MTGWTSGHSAALLQQRLVGVNFHHIARENRLAVTERLRFAAELGASLDPDEPGTPRSPRTFVAFYDGYRDTGLFGAELCSQLGIRAFFFPIFSSVDPARAKLTDADLQQISTVHELCFHSWSHVGSAEVTADTLQREVLTPMERLRSISGRLPRVGAWRGGTRFDEQSLGDRSLRELGLRHLVSNWSIERVPSGTA